MSRKLSIVFVLGFATGLAAYAIWLSLGNQTVVQDAAIAELDALRWENDQLFDELLDLAARNTKFSIEDIAPYDEEVEGRALFEKVRAESREQAKFLMVTFGANWCPDCRTLYHHLESKDVKSYVAERFVIANIDVGRFDKNTELADELGLDLSSGIPVAVFFDANGDQIGNTNAGELEPARLYTSSQILRFVRDVAEHSRIVAPDKVQ